MGLIGWSLTFKRYGFLSTALTAQMPTSTPVHRIAITSWFQGWQVFLINHQRRSVNVAQNDLSFTLSSACRNMQLLVSVISLLKFGHTYFITALKQSNTENTNGQNNNDKVKKPTLGSHSVFVNYCMHIFVYFCITNNKVKATLIVLSIVIFYKIFT